MNRFGAYAPVAPLLQSALDSTSSASIMDMCSGGGGPWLTFLPGCIPTIAPAPCKSCSLINIQISPPSNPPAPPHKITSHSIPLRWTPRTSHRNSAASAPCSLPSIISSPPKLAPSCKMPWTPAKPSAYLKSPAAPRPPSRRCFFGRCFRSSSPRGFAPSAGRACSAPMSSHNSVGPALRWVVSCLRTYRPQELREIIAKLSPTEYQWD